MIISSELFQSVCILDNNTSKCIATTLKSKLNDIIFTGFPLSDSFSNGYLKGINLLIKLLLSDLDSKEDILNQINTLDLSFYLYNSCKSCFNNGFMQAINQFNLEMKIYN
nr:hypothetical protein [uncultured Romboutsia sp.]